MTTAVLNWGFMMITLALVAVWTYAAVQIHQLARRPSRVGVRLAARRARSALVVGLLLVPAADAAIAGLWPDGARFTATPAALAMPLLVLPAAGTVIWSLPRLGRLVRALYTDPWGPSDPPVRAAGADPALAAPAHAAVLGALATVAAVPYGVAAAIGSYVLVAAVVGALWPVLARRRQRVRATRGTALRRALTVHGADGLPEPAGRGGTGAARPATAATAPATRPEGGTQPEVLVR